MIDNCIWATKRLLDLLNIKSTSKYLKENILSHPDHPSLLSIADTLEKYQMDTLAVKIDLKKLEDIPMPCIVQVDVERESLFFVLKNVFKETVCYYDNRNIVKTTTTKDFLKIWSGICLLVETRKQSKEKNIEKKIATKQKQNVLKISIAVLLITWIAFSVLNPERPTNISSAFYIITYLILKVIGLAAGVFLLWFDIDSHNPILQNFCIGNSQKINCNAVLDSKYAKLFKGSLSLSLLSFTYFFGTLVYLFIYRFDPTSLSVLGILSLICFPVVFISIYYQAVVIKQWCKFCILIQAVLISEISIAFIGKFYKTSMDYEALPLLVTLFLIPILIWEFLKPLLEQEKKVSAYKRDLRKIKNNPSILNGLLLKSRKINTSTDGLGISITNSLATYDVIKVCNPYCTPCAKAHVILEDMVNNGDINLQMIFTAKADGKDLKAKPVSHFLAIDARGNANHTKQVLADWYHAKQKDYSLFSNRYEINGELGQQNDKIQAMRAWCDAENITHTPTIFINGYELPKEYSVEDLREIFN